MECGQKTLVLNSSRGYPLLVARRNACGLSLITLLLVASSCRGSFEPADPSQDHYVKIGKMTCLRPADISESAHEIEHEATVEIKTAVVAGSVGGGMREFGRTLYYNGRSELTKEFILCSAIGNGYLTPEHAREMRQGYTSALKSEVDIDEKYEDRDKAARMQKMADDINETKLLPLAPAPKCNAEVVGVVKHLLNACENERRECPDEPLPLRMTIEEYEKLIASLPIYPVFFESGKDGLSERQESEINELSRSAIGSAKTVLVIGRASKSGKTRQNRALARSRAQNVRNQLEKRSSKPSNVKYELFIYGDSTLYMNPEGLLGQAFVTKYRDVDHLNQSVWIVIYDC